MADAFDLAMSRGEVTSTITRVNAETGERRVARTEHAPDEFTGHAIAEACMKGCTLARRKDENNATLAQRRGRGEKLVTGDEARNAALAILGFGGENAELTPDEQGEGAGENAGAGGGARQQPGTTANPGNRR